MGSLERSCRYFRETPLSAYCGTGDTFGYIAQQYSAIKRIRRVNENDERINTIIGNQERLKIGLSDHLTC